ncbi:dihydrolipoyl dehydrogenase [Omnitrophica bacterium]|nr:dihydrolipoyl dehydrogenase [Candidatus Omnitrophota bacterium]
MNKYDIAIIGAGPGGYVAALYAAGSGKRVVVIEKESLGGVCLNWGCIPTKTLIASAEALKCVKRSKELGIDVPSYTIDYKIIKKRKDDVISVLKKGIESLFKSKKIELKKGHGRLVDKGVVEVNGETVEAKNIIIATGSRPAQLPNFKFDKKRICSSRDILDLETLPQKLLVIGGGVNGCEYAYTYSHFGVEVAIVEIMDRLLPTLDKELGKNMEMILKKAGVKVMTKTRLEELPPEYDKVVICVGRRYNSEDLGLEKLNIETDKGRIIVDENLRTNAPGIYAIGDVIGGYLLAHVASHEGIVACNNIMDRSSRMDYGSVPLCIYTDPQIAMTGLTERQAKEKGHDVKVSKFPFRGIGKSHAIGEKDGFVKIIGDKKQNEVLGVQMVGHQVTELIAEATAVVKNKMNAKEICEIIHAHPTLSEAFMEAAFLFNGTPIHSI